MGTKINLWGTTTLPLGKNVMIKRVQKLKEQGSGGSAPYKMATITAPSREGEILGIIYTSWVDTRRKQNLTLGPPQILVKLK